ncbi:hypothetical protein OJAV_G00049280 [Oryzias javanicus]|uniref:Uncharacterized protein n=1 Tax=Oryzias javanicus TaxID=123683 RepID=A0A3S2Q880_ORYJA|nr:hypothetical protein OJAV_G00049280 [Oryzias javanicus]
MQNNHQSNMKAFSDIRCSPKEGNDEENQMSKSSFWHLLSEEHSHKCKAKNKKSNCEKMLDKEWTKTIPSVLESSMFWRGLMLGNLRRRGQKTRRDRETYKKRHRWSAISRNVIVQKTSELRPAVACRPSGKIQELIVIHRCKILHFLKDSSTTRRKQEKTSPTQVDPVRIPAEESRETPEITPLPRPSQESREEGKKKGVEGDGELERRRSDAARRRTRGPPPGVLRTEDGRDRRRRPAQRDHLPTLHIRNSSTCSLLVLLGTGGLRRHLLRAKLTPPAD